MAAEKNVVGTGMTAGTEVRFLAPFTAEDISALRSLPSLPTLEALLSFAEQVAAKVLEDAGLPDSFGMYARIGSRPWTRLVEIADELVGARERGETTSYTSGVWLIAKNEGYEPDSPVGYAARIADAAGRIRLHCENREVEKACLTSMELGGLMREAEIKHLWEPSALTGQKVRHELPGSNHGGRRSGSTIARDCRLAQEYMRRRKTSRLSDTALKVSVGAVDGLGRTASVDAINRGLQKLSG